MLFLVNSWPLWVVEASDNPSALFVLMLNSLLNHTVFNISILWLAIGQVYSTANHHRLLRQKAAKYHIRTQKYTKLHAQNIISALQSLFFVTKLPKYTNSETHCSMSPSTECDRWTVIRLNVKHHEFVQNAAKLDPQAKLCQHFCNRLYLTQLSRLTYDKFL